MDTQPVSPSIPVAFSGDIPKNYDAYLGSIFFDSYAADMADRIRKLNPKSVLEIASGTGRLTRLISSVLGKDTRIIASDLNPAMISFGQSQTPPDVKWMEIDAHSLPFDDNSFDCIVAQFGVMFYNDRVKAFSEARRVLKPGGAFIFNCWDELKNNQIADIVNKALHHFFPVDTPGFYSIPFSYYDEEKIKRDITAAGFDKTEIELVKLKGKSKSSSDAAKGLIEGTPTITAIKERNTDVQKIINYIQDKISEKYGTGPFDVPLQARVVTCIK
jgi:ubiquinone/menaquinone biosynthesis C-methylase UbiE